MPAYSPFTERDARHFATTMRAAPGGREQNKFFNRLRFMYALQLGLNKPLPPTKGAQLAPNPNPRPPLITAPTFDELKTTDSVANRVQVVRGDIDDVIAYTGSICPGQVPWVVPCLDGFKVGGGAYSGQPALNEEFSRNTGMHQAEVGYIAQQYGTVPVQKQFGRAYCSYPPLLQNGLAAGHALVSRDVPVYTQPNTTVHVVGQEFPNWGSYKGKMPTPPIELSPDGKKQWLHNVYATLMENLLRHQLDIVSKSKSKLLIAVAAGQGVYMPLYCKNLPIWDKGAGQWRQYHSSTQLALIYKKLLAEPQFKDIRVVMCVRDDHSRNSVNGPTDMADCFAAVLQDGQRPIEAPKVGWGRDYARGFQAFLAAKQNLTAAQLIAEQNQLMQRSAQSSLAATPSAAPLPSGTIVPGQSDFTFANPATQAAYILSAYNAYAAPALRINQAAALKLLEDNRVAVNVPDRIKLSLHMGRVTAAQAQHFAGFIQQHLKASGKLALRPFDGGRFQYLALTQQQIQSCVQSIAANPIPTELKARPVTAPVAAAIDKAFMFPNPLARAAVVTSIVDAYNAQGRPHITAEQLKLIEDNTVHQASSGRIKLSLADGGAGAQLTPSQLAGFAEFVQAALGLADKPRLQKHTDRRSGQVYQYLDLSRAELEKLLTAVKRPQAATRAKRKASLLRRINPFNPFFGGAGLGAQPVLETPPAAQPVLETPPAAQPVLETPPAAQPVLETPPAAQLVLETPPAAQPVLETPPAVGSTLPASLPAQPAPVAPRPPQPSGSAASPTAQDSATALAVPLTVEPPALTSSIQPETKPKSQSWTVRDVLWVVFNILTLGIPALIHYCFFSGSSQTQPEPNRNQSARFPIDESAAPQSTTTAASDYSSGNRAVPDAILEQARTARLGV